MAQRVLTPGGFRDSRLVHQLLPGHALDASEEGFRKLNLATQAYVESAQVEVEVVQAAEFASGWIAYGEWINNTGAPVTSFRTQWKVPKAPATQNGQTIFLFNGIDPSNTGEGILQPVLQWGPSAAGGGPYWTIASWYVSTSGACHTPLRIVDEGDTLTGLMTLTSAENGRFSYVAEFEGVPGARLPVHNVPELVFCNLTLEAYAITQCTDYPADDFTLMSEIALKTGALTPPITWAPVVDVKDCGQDARPSAAGLELRYR